MPNGNGNGQTVKVLASRNGYNPAPVPTIMYDKPIGPERPVPAVKERKEPKPKAIHQYDRPIGPKEPKVPRTGGRAVQRAERFLGVKEKKKEPGLHGFRKRAEAGERKFARATRPLRSKVGPKRPRPARGRRGSGWKKTHFKTRALGRHSTARRGSSRRGRPRRSGGWFTGGWFSKRR